MVTKRCYAQQCRFRPDPDQPVVQTIEYSLAYAAGKYDIDLHEFFFNANHEHESLTDRFAKRPRFLQLFHSFVARGINQIYGDTDSLYSSQRHSDPIALDPEKVFEWSVYILNNAVKDGLVRYPWDWPGVTSWALEYNEPKVVARPPFFSEDMPEEVELVIRRPPGVRPDLDDRALRRLIRERARLQAGDIAAQFKVQAKRFKGVRQICRQPRLSSPKRRKLRDGIRPRVAGGDREARQAELAALDTFVVEHEAARQQRIAGDCSARFPYGTYLARVRDGAPCHGPAP